MEAFTTPPVTNCGPKILLPPLLPLQLSFLHPFPPSPLPLLLPPPSPHLSMFPHPSPPPPPPLPTLPHPKLHLTQQQVQLEQLSTLLRNYTILGLATPMTQIVIKS